MTDPAELWRLALEELTSQVSRANFDTWLKGTVGLEFDGERFVVGVPSALEADWLQNRLASMIRRALAAVAARPVTVEFRVVRRDGQANGVARAEPGAVVTVRAPTGRVGFERLVVGRWNLAAYRAAVEVADAPGSRHNPVFVWSGCGLGKTALLLAVGDRLSAERPGLRVLYVTAGQFKDQLFGALRQRRAEGFREHYAAVDVLLFDDVDFLRDNEAAQAELMQTFDRLHATGRQLVFAGRQPPAQLRGIDPALVSRLAGGLVVGIGAPGPDERVAFLKAKADQLGARLPRVVLDLIAEACPPDLRQLEGWLRTVVHYGRLRGAELDVQLAAQALEPLCGPLPRRGLVRPESVLDVVAEYYGVPLDEIRGPSRRREPCFVRHVAMYLLRELTDLSLNEIARLVGRGDHATVVNGAERVARAVAQSRDRRQELEELAWRIVGRALRDRWDAV